MKVVFIVPYYKNQWESLSIGYISSYIKKNYIGNLVVDFYQAYFDNDEIIINGCKDADVIGFSCTSPTFKHGVNLSNKIKEINSNVWSVFGGYHVSNVKEDSLIKGIDQIVIGEGEKAFLSILNGNRDKIVIGEKLNWDQLEIPDRDLIKVNRTIDLCEKMIGKRITSLQANRGCPFHCRYCGERSITGLINKNNPIRTRDVDDILDEVELITKKYNLDMFKFCDATFDVSSEFVIEFCKRKIERNITIEWEAMVHANLAKEEIFSWLKKAKCNQINVGCESGSNKILKDMRKGTNVEKIKEVFKWAKDAGIKRRAFFIIGMPEENIEDILLTRNLMIDLEADYVGVTMLCPYPGSDFYNKYTMSNIEWEKTDEYSNDIWSNNCFTNEGLKNIQNFLISSVNESNIVLRQKQ